MRLLSPARRGLCAALFATAVLAGCQCKGGKLAGACASDQECQELNHNDQWVCDQRGEPSTCKLDRRACDTAADCCPSQICIPQHICQDKYTVCTPGPTPRGTCGLAGQVCKAIGVYPPPEAGGCSWEKCGAGGSCADGTACFNGYCVSEPPCQSCIGPGKVCVTATNVCSPAPPAASCQRSCPAGQMLVLRDPAQIFDGCDLKSVGCDCVSLPPLVAHDVARHSSLAQAGGQLYVAAYDGEYGDLVVHTYEKANLAKPVKSEWIDGVPPAGHVGGDPDGPRHGITDRGPDVGQYTALAASPAGDLYLAYYDVDSGDLKFTARYGGSQWTAPVVIDGSNGPVSTGDVGLYNSIAVTSAGVPAIAYFRRGSVDPVTHEETGPSTGLVYAIAKKARPVARDDWTVVGDVDRADRPPPPCGGSCPQGQVCVADPAAPGGERCATTTGGCAPACGGNQTCVQGTDPGHTPACLAARGADAISELPAGVGLMPSLQFIDGRPIVAYYDSIHRSLKAAMGNGPAAAPGWSTPVTIDGDDGSGRDVGRFPALAVGPASATGGRIAIAYPDQTSQQLLLYQSSGLTAHAAHDGAASSGLIHVVDDGTWRPGSGDWHARTLPGAQTAIAFTASGKIALAYQDATPVDLTFGAWDPLALKLSKSVIRATGGTGFWPRLVLDGQTAYISSASIHAATADLAQNTLWLDRQNAP